MKICGCKACELAGEINPYAEFERYLEQRDKDELERFEEQFKASYSAGEMEELYDELESQFNGESKVVARIKSYSISDNTWNAYEYLRGRYGNFHRRPSAE